MPLSFKFIFFAFRKKGLRVTGNRHFLQRTKFRLVGIDGMLCPKGQGLWKARMGPGGASDAHAPGHPPGLSVGPSGPSKTCNLSLCPCQGHRADNSALLASPLLKRFTWTESKAPASLKTSLRVTSRSKESGLCHPGCGHGAAGRRRFTYDNCELERAMSCCAPPPDYNSVVLYATPPV